MFKGIMILGLAALAVAGCTRGSDSPEDPKHRLSGYISRSFAIKDTEDRKELLGYLTGDAKVRLANWSDDQFRLAFIDSKREFVKLAFREIKPVSRTEMNITYEVTFLQGQDKGVKVTNKKLCQMILDQGKWMIADVKNIKELVEFQNEMSLP